MTVTSGFFNSVNGDRKYDAIDIARIFDGIMEDGVHKGIGTDFFVTATGGTDLNVGKGRAWFNHTWTFNDVDLPVLGGASNAALPRIDAVILEVNLADNARQNTIKIKQGVAASPAIQPAMTHTEELHEYPLAWITRAAGSSIITQAHITQAVGTPGTPYAVSRLLDRSFEPSSMHRQYFRGKNLGTAYTAAQKLAIQNGSFEDLYIGDYWVINGITWRIADFNYYMNTGREEYLVTKPHAIVMPDTTLRSGKMQENIHVNNVTGYLGTTARGAHFTALRATIVAAFGNENLMQWDQIMTTQQASGVPANAAFQLATVEIPNQSMMIGSQLFVPSGTNGGAPASIQTESTAQLSLFRLAPEFIRAKNASDVDRASWTRDFITPYFWAIVGGTGGMTYTWGHATHGFRPYFALG